MNRREIFYGTFLSISSLIIVISFVLYPGEVFHSSLRGLTIWWEVVFPATLPFFVVAELLMGLGLAHFFGVLLEPVMRPLFNVPGAGSFVLAMGFSSGYPMAAKLTTLLRAKGLITKGEGERLVAFTTTSDPLFIFGAVAVGFFQRPLLGIFLAGIHYVTAVIVGLLMRFHDRRGKVTPVKEQEDFLLLRAFRAMNQARREDGRTLGKLLSESVSRSIQTLLLIGGLIMIFSVFMKLLEVLHVSLLLKWAFQGLLIFFHIPQPLSISLVNGLFEVTLGVKSAASEGIGIPLIHQVAMASAILAWGGLSVHAQIASILSQTDLSYKPLLVARLLHVGLATSGTYLLWDRTPSLSNTPTVPVFSRTFSLEDYWWQSVLYFTRFFYLLFALMICLGILLTLHQRLFKKG